MVKVTYRPSSGGEYTATVDFNETSMQKLIRQHVTDKQAYLWTPDFEGFKINFVKDGLVEMWAYHKANEIITLLENPWSLIKGYDFPIQLSKELEEQINEC